MDAAAELENLSREMYEHHAVDGVGVAYFERFRARLERWAFAAVVTQQTRRYEDAYVREFLLSTPFLWEHLPPSVWLDLIRDQSWRPRPNLPRELAAGVYGDVTFLTATVGVDALAYVLENETVEVGAKRRIAAHFWSFPYPLVPDPGDPDELERDGRYVRREVIDRLHRALVSDFGLRPVAFTSEDVLDRIEALVRPLGVIEREVAIRRVFATRLGDAD